MYWTMARKSEWRPDLGGSKDKDGKVQSWGRSEFGIDHQRVQVAVLNDAEEDAGQPHTGIQFVVVPDSR